MNNQDPFGYDKTPPGTFNDPSRPAVYSPAELDFRDLHTNPNRREEYARWCAEARARWAEGDPPNPAFDKWLRELPSLLAQCRGTRATSKREALVPEVGDQ